MQFVKLYVADDDARVRATIEHIFRRKHFIVHGYATGTDLLAVVKSECPDCILLDVKMPVMSGIQILKALTALEFSGAILMISGQGDIPTAVESIQLGAMDFIEKPFRALEVFSRVVSCLRLVEARRLAAAPVVPKKPSGESSLTLREREVLDELSLGATSKVVARKLGVSPRTIDTHRAHILEKIQFSQFISNAHNFAEDPGGELAAAANARDEPAYEARGLPRNLNLVVKVTDKKGTEIFLEPLLRVKSGTQKSASSRYPASVTRDSDVRSQNEDRHVLQEGVPYSPRNKGNVIFFGAEDTAISSALSAAFTRAGYRVTQRNDVASLVYCLNTLSPRCVLLSSKLRGTVAIDCLKMLVLYEYGGPTIILADDGDVAPLIEMIHRKSNNNRDFNFTQLDVQTVTKLILESITKATPQPPEANEIAPFSRPDFGSLTSRENEVLRQIFAAATSKEIAKNLNVSSRTIDIHRSHILKKLGAKNTADLIRIVVISGHRC